MEFNLKAWKSVACFAILNDFDSDAWECQSSGNGGFPSTVRTEKDGKAWKSMEESMGKEWDHGEIVGMKHGDGSQEKRGKSTVCRGETAHTQ